MKPGQAAGAPGTGRVERAARAAAVRILETHHPRRTAPVPLLQILQDAHYTIGRKKDPVSITSFYLRDALGRHTIGLNTRLGPSAQRVALAHAMAHGELHEADLLICLEVRTSRLERREQRHATHPTTAMEQQAHQFAIELLMPAAAVREAVDRYCGEADNPVREGLVRHLATAFKVTDTAAGYRLVDLAILTP